MTNEEAIEVLKDEFPMCGKEIFSYGFDMCERCENKCREREGFDLAIECLSKADIFQNAPLDTKLYFICSDCRLYVGTLTKSVKGDIVRGECFEGDADTFYRCSIIAWASCDK